MVALSDTDFRESGSIDAVMADTADAIAALRASRDASEEIAPGYMPMIEARLYDFDIFMAWVKNGNSNNPPKPFRVLSAEELASL